MKYNLYYKASDIGNPHLMETAKSDADKDEFLFLRGILAKALDYNVVEGEGEIKIYDNNKEVGRYYAKRI